MKIISKEEFLSNEKLYLSEIRSGKIFIYPTDTIYGIGCNATNSRSIEKIRKIKNRDNKPFSIIIPDKQWIINNCITDDKDKEFIDKLPGKFTLIFKLKDYSNIAKNELIGDFDSIGVRIPDNWFSKILSKNNLVFVTTSVNITGEKPITNIQELKEEILSKIDYIIPSGTLDNKPSQVINLSKDTVEILR